MESMFTKFLYDVPFLSKTGSKRTKRVMFISIQNFYF